MLIHLAAIFISLTLAASPAHGQQLHLISLLCSESIWFQQRQPRHRLPCVPVQRCTTTCHWGYLCLIASEWDKKTIELHLSSTWSDNSRFFCSSKQICKGMHIVVTWWVPSAVHVVAAVTHRMKSWPCRATRADMHDALGDGYVPHTTPLPPPLNVKLTMAVRFGAQRWVGRLARKTMMTARTSTLAHPDLHPTLIHVARSLLPMSRIALIHTVGNLPLQICHQVRCLERGGQPRVSLRLEHACSTHDLGIRGRRGAAWSTPPTP